MRQFHGCYSVDDDALCGVVRRRKSAADTLAALKSIRAARLDGASIHITLDDLSAHRGVIEAYFGPLRMFTVAGSNRANHPSPTEAIQADPRWRNANGRHPDVLAARRRERARIRSQGQRRWSQPTARTAA